MNVNLVWIQVAGTALAAIIAFLGTASLCRAFAGGSRVRNALFFVYALAGLWLVQVRAVHIEGFGPAGRRLFLWNAIATFLGAGLAALSGFAATATRRVSADRTNNAWPSGKYAVNRLFEAAKSRHEQYASAHTVDYFGLTLEATEAAGRDASLQTAEHELGQVVEWCRAQSLPTLTACALTQLGMLYACQGRNGKARDCLSEATTVWKTTPNTDKGIILAKSSCHCHLGALYFLDSNLTDAETCFKQALTEAQACGTVRNEAMSREGLERVRQSRGSSS